VVRTIAPTVDSCKHPVTSIPPSHQILATPLTTAAFRSWFRKPCWPLCWQCEVYNDNWVPYSPCLVGL